MGRVKKTRNYHRLRLHDDVIRFLLKVRFMPNGCVEWTAAYKQYKNGARYGSFWFEGKLQAAHRVFHKLFRGALADDLELDHLCRNTICVLHTEPVTKQENIRRAMRDLCPQGHPKSGDNLIVEKNSRRCRICHYARNRARRRK